MSLLSYNSSFFSFSNVAHNLVTVEIAGQILSGWTQISIRTGIEIMPSTFDLECTEYYPNTDEINITEGEACVIRIGNDPVITGYIVTVNRRLGPRQHTISIQGVSKSTDLCECSAEFETYQFNNIPVWKLIQSICSKYNIGVKTQGNVGKTTIPQFSVILTETGYQIIERMTRAAALLFYDSPDGNIILSQAGSELAASGFVEKENIEEAIVRKSMAGRFQSITVILQNTSSLFHSPGGDSQLAADIKNITTGKPAIDPGVKRYRPMLISAEMGDAGYQVSQQRAQWEVNRRYGRSQSVQLVTDSWRDASGALWRPNTLAPVSLPTLKMASGKNMLISEVVFRLDSDGTHAEIVLMPPEAFLPEPIVLNPSNSAIVQATAGK